MNKRSSILLTGLAALAWCFSASAQTEQPENEVPPPPRFEDVTTSQDADSGFLVEERRYENRLEGVTVEHKKSGLREYYNLNDPDVERRDGGIAEGSAMRVWRLGGK